MIMITAVINILNVPDVSYHSYAGCMSSLWRPLQITVRWCFIFHSNMWNVNFLLRNLKASRNKMAHYDNGHICLQCVITVMTLLCHVILMLFTWHPSNMVLPYLTRLSDCGVLKHFKHMIRLCHFMLIGTIRRKTHFFLTWKTFLYIYFLHKIKFCPWSRFLNGHFWQVKVKFFFQV